MMNSVLPVKESNLIPPPKPNSSSNFRSFRKPQSQRKDAATFRAELRFVYQGVSDEDSEEYACGGSVSVAGWECRHRVRSVWAGVSLPGAERVTGQRRSLGLSGRSQRRKP